MKEKISRNKISRHYKSFFGLENMESSENDNLMIDWGESLVNDFCNQEVEKRIKERMPSEDETQIAQNEYEAKEEWTRYNTQWCFRDFIAGVDWLRSRLTCSKKPNNSQKTEGGEG